MARGYSITVRATDAHGNTFDKGFDIEVTDVDETPADDPLPPGDDEPDDEGNFDTPPYSVEVDGAVKLAGKKKANGSIAKFIHDIYDEVPLEAGTIYTMRYDPDFSLMSQGGELAMVGFMFKSGNDFYLIGLRGDGSTGVHAYEVRGDNLWNQTAGFTTDDGGAAAHGTQAGPNWIQLETSADGTEITFRTSSDGSSWTDEYTDRAITPFDDVTQVTAWGPGAFFHGDDDGPYSIAVDLWTNEPSATWQEVFSATLNGDQATWSGWNIRQRIHAAALSNVVGTKIRVTLEAASGEGATFDRCTAGHGAVTDPDMDGSQVTLTVGGSTAFTVPAGNSVLTDEIAFAFDGTKDLYVNGVFNTAATDGLRRNTAAGVNVTRYIKNVGTDETLTSDVTGYAGSNETLMFVNKIEVLV